MHCGSLGPRLWPCCPCSGLGVGTVPGGVARGAVSWLLGLTSAGKCLGTNQRAKDVSAQAVWGRPPWRAAGSCSTVRPTSWALFSHLAALSFLGVRVQAG